MARKLLIVLIIVIIASGVSAQDKYKKFDRSKLEHDMIRLTMSGSEIMLAYYSGDLKKEYRFGNSDINQTKDRIMINKTPIITAEGFLLDSLLLLPEDIYRVMIEADVNRTEILFKKRSVTSPLKASKKRNMVALLNNLYVNRDRFVRGSVISFWGDIEVDGEVNEDVIAVYGNIYIGEDAIVRGDIIALNGQVDVAGSSTVYGEIQSVSLKDHYSFKKRQRWFRRDKYFDAYGKFSYNRVDGAAPYLGFKFIDEDSLLPRITAYGGYGFASERGRYFFGVEQSVLRGERLSAGVEVYKKLATDDDWIISDAHNTFFALVATEDYKDYYEAEGGQFYFTGKPIKGLNFRVGAVIEKHNWLDAHTELWSLFGGSKRFSENFGSLPPSIREAGKTAMDDKDFRALELEVNYRSRFPLVLFTSFWSVNAWMETAPDSWNDDYDFTRYILSGKRFQCLSRSTALFFEGKYGNSDGALPIHKMFYLGGINSLLGYKNKEIYGSEFWLARSQFIFNIPKTDLNLWLFYEAGQITAETGKLSDAEVKQDIGLGLSIDDGLRFNIAKRLDRSESTYRVSFNLNLNI